MCIVSVKYVINSQHGVKAREMHKEHISIISKFRYWTDIDIDTFLTEISIVIRYFKAKVSTF